MANRKRKRGPRGGGGEPTAEAERLRARAAATVEGADAAHVEPVFFFGFAVPRAKLAFARFWIFGVLAIDAFLQLRHAPRYGAGGFNVGHLAIFDGAAPARAAIGVVQVALVYLFTAIAFGVGSRLVVAVAAALYAWVYFASQLDSYQHHYLMVLVLGLAIGVPWFRPRGTARADGARPVATWALRVILIQLGVLYLWAAIAKLDPGWLDGTAFRASLHHGRVYDLIDGTVGFRLAARLVVLVELFLAVAIWIRPLWPGALVVGVGMHVGIAFTNLEIGVFSWLMVALYLLVVPDRWFLAAWRRLSPARALDALEARLAAIPPVGGALLLVALAGAAVLAIPVDGAIAGALVGGLVVVAGDAFLTGPRPPRVAAGAAILAGAGLAALLAAKTTVVPDYYKFWGGSSRRLGYIADARHAYARATEAAPADPWNHFQLGRMLLQTDDGLAVDEARGLAALHRAQALEPTKARAFVAEATYLATAGKPDAALAAARAGLAAEPGSADARSLADALARGDVEKPRPPPEPAPDPATEDEGTP